MSRYFVLLAAAALLFGGALPAKAAPTADEGIIGTILQVEGTATLRPAGLKDAAPLAAQAHLHMHDVIETGAKSRVFILFIDNTQMTLSDNTKLTVDEYVFDPGNKPANKAAYNVLQGTFEYLSGLVAKKKDPDVKIETAYGAIGIRGTQLWGGYIGHGYGIHVTEGQIGVANGGGSVIVNKDEGTIIPGPGEPPGPPGPWSEEQLGQIGPSISLHNHDALLKLIDAQKGKNKGLTLKFHEFLEKHHHGQQGENGEPDTRMKDLPMDETGEPDLAPFSPGGASQLGGGG